MPDELPLTENLFWRGSGSLRIPSSFRRLHNIALGDIPDPIRAETRRTKDEVHLTYVFPSSAFPKNKETK